MKANAIFIHKNQSRHVLEVDGDTYFVIQSRKRAGIAPADIISGDLTLHDVKWVLNITRGILVDIEVLGRHATAQEAIVAATFVEDKQTDFIADR